MFKLDVDELWQYSLAVYQQEEVRLACLALQDSMQVNVNVLLSMMYLCKRQRMYDFDDIGKIEEAISQSDKALKRHRAKRRGLKNIDAGRYQKALDQELILEKAQQVEIVNFANTLFFPYMRSSEELSDQIAALCLRRITNTRSKREQKLDPRKISDEVLKACGTLAEYV